MQMIQKWAVFLLQNQVYFILLRSFFYCKYIHLETDMENMHRLKTTESSRSHTSIKFRPVKGEYNELQSKYEIYKKGTPNQYQTNMDHLKVYPIKNEIKTLQIPAIDHVLKELKNIQSNTGSNLRDFTIHPSMMQKYGNKFRNLISDSQEIKDFMDWFNKKEKEIQSKTISSIERFYLYQNLIASGFNEMLNQISFVSKLRADVLKTLWNKQNSEVEQIFNCMHKQNSEFQKTNLEGMKELHLGYQDQIIRLRNDNYCAQKKLEEAVVLNESCINSLRTMRKQIKKYQKIIKQMADSNYSLKEQSLHLLEENIRLVMKQQNLPLEKAKVLAYQRLQSRNLRNQLRAGAKNPKKIFKEVKNKAESLVDNNQLPDLDEKKEKLVKYIMNRVKENPGEKKFLIKSELSDEDDQEVVLEETIESMIKCKQIKSQILIKPAKPPSFFHDKSVNTDSVCLLPTSSQVAQESIAVQTSNTAYEKPLLNNRSWIQNEEFEGKKILKKKKIEQRHSLMMIEMNKMMEFKKMDGQAKNIRISMHSKSDSIKPSRFSNMSGLSRNNERKESVREDDVVSRIQDSFKDDTEVKAQNKEQKKREANIRRRHQNSLIDQKSSQFIQMILKIGKEIIEPKTKEKLIQEEEEEEEEEEHAKAKMSNENMYELKELVRKYSDKRILEKELTCNPEKQLKKILTQTFRNIFISKQEDFLNELVRTAKNIFGNVIYENKLVHLMSLIIQHKQNSLLGSLNILMAVTASHQFDLKVSQDDLNEIYFRIYFFLSLKSPVQNQFNIWCNYTTVQKISSQNFTVLLKQYFGENKCMYLQLKIRQFIGISNDEQSSENNSYVQLNPLMMYILEVYLLEKRNYYESYYQIIDFLCDSKDLELESLIFLLDLLCFKEDEQKQIIKEELRDRKEVENCTTNKDIFYRICVKYEVPLFEFIKILKMQQFKKIHQTLNNDFSDISDLQKWIKVKDIIEKSLNLKSAYSKNMRTIISKLNKHIQLGLPINNEPFLFFYRIAIHTAFSPL